MSHEQLIGSAEAARRLDIDRSTLSRWVSAGRITPAGRLSDTPTGALLFELADVEALKAALAKDKEPAA